MLERAHALLQRLGERAADRHGFADRLHAGPEHGDGTGQLLEGPARHLGDDVVDRRLEARRSLLRDVVRNFVERVAHGEAGRDLGDREARSPSTRDAELRDTRGFISMTTRSPFFGFTANCMFEPPVSTPMRRMQANGGVAHLLVLDVAQSLRRRDGDRVAGVNAHRVEILDRADDHAVVGAVAHHLELVLLPTRDRSLDEDLADRRCVETLHGQPA